MTNHPARPETDSPNLAPSRWRSPHRALVGFFGVVFVAMLLAAFAAISTANWELTSRRVLAVTVIPLVTALASLSLAVHFHSSPARAERFWNSIIPPSRIPKLLLVMGFLFLVSALAALMPSSRLIRWAAYHEILIPLLLALAITCAAAFAILLVRSRDVHIASWESLYRSNRRTLLVALAFFSGMVLVWLFIANTGRGIKSTEDFWFGAGSPLLFQQLLAGLGICLLYSAFESRFIAWIERVTRSRISTDLTLFLVIWFVAAVFWALQPAPFGFMALRPLPPNNELYPFADSLRYDLGSQFALIGQDLNDGRFYHRVFYMGYLFVLHALFGQRYEHLMTVQAILFAVFPALVYLLGKTLKDRRFGILAATAVAFTGYNSIPGSFSADLANPKQMLTDFPSAIGVVAFTLLIVRWWKNPERTSHLFWAAGVLGVAALARASVFGLLPVLLLLVWIAVPRACTGKAILSALAVFVFLSGAIPWSIRYDRFIGDLYFAKFRSVVEQRYGETPSPARAEFFGEALGPRDPLVVAIPDHFLHNLTTSVLTLPPSPVFHDLRTVLREEFPYWDAYWDGELDTATSLAILVNLLILAIGIGAALQTSGRAGLIPLLIFFAFCGINSLGRTSGGRYVAPTDWVLLFYFAWGVLFLIQTMLAKFVPAPKEEDAVRVETRPASFPFRAVLAKSFPAFIVMFGVSAVMVLWSSLIPQRYADVTEESLYTEFIDSGFGEQTSFGVDALRDFIKEEHAGIWTGRALYPRYYQAGQGIKIIWPAFDVKPYPRLVFSLVGPHGSEFVVLPGPPPKKFPNAVDVMVLGCQVDDSIMALVVLVQTPVPYMYEVPAAASTICPLELQE